MQHSKTILIVEDNPTNLKLVKDVLNYEKYNTVEATDGKIALDTIENNYEKIDLILMDLQLPEIGGLEVIKKVKNNPETKDIPIIVVSAHAMESDIKKCYKAGCTDYITKPLNIREFIKRINTFFEQN